jgi:hypothetical protein
LFSQLPCNGLPDRAGRAGNQRHMIQDSFPLPYYDLALVNVSSMNEAMVATHHRSIGHGRGSHQRPDNHQVIHEHVSGTP